MWCTVVTKQIHSHNTLRAYTYTYVQLCARKYIYGKTKTNKTSFGMKKIVYSEHKKKITTKRLSFSFIYYYFPSWCGVCARGAIYIWRVFMFLYEHFLFALWPTIFNCIVNWSWNFIQLNWGFFSSLQKKKPFRTKEKSFILIFVH